MAVQVVLVHGIRTSATMWRAQLVDLAGRGVPAVAVDLPGHGARRAETFTLGEALATIDRAVTDAAARGPVLLVGHSMGGLLTMACAGRDGEAPPIAALVAVSATALPRGLGLRAYRMLARGLDLLPHNGRWLTERVLRATLPESTRGDFGAGGYAYLAQDTALRSLASLDLVAALRRIRVPLWFVNGQWDQLRIDERLFTALKPEAELIVIPRSTHLVTAMRPEAFAAVLDLVLATMADGEAPGAGHAFGADGAAPGAGHPAGADGGAGAG